MRKKTHKAAPGGPLGFSRKLLLAFLASSVVPILVVGAIAYQRAYTIARDSIMESVAYTSQQSGQSVANRLAQMEKVSDFTQFQLYRISTRQDDSLTYYFDQYLEMANNLTSLTYSFDLYSVNVFLQPDELIAQEGLMFAPLETMADYGFDLDMMEDPVARRLEWKMLDGVLVRRTPLRNERDDYLCCYWLKRDVLSGEVEYAYFITLQCSEVAALLESPDEQVARFLVDENGTVLAHNDPAMVGTTLPAGMYAGGGREEGYRHTDGQYITAHTLPGYNWQIVTTVAESYIRQQATSLIAIVLAALGSVLCAVLFVVAFLSRSMSRKVDILSGTMRKYKTSGDKKGLGRLTPLVDTSPAMRDEFDEMAVDFTEMAHRLEQSFAEKMDYELREQRLSYQLLQAKINPHFLYNILESIKMCISMGKEETAVEMVTKLVAFYRQQLGRAGELVSIGEELENARTYLEIESMARGGQIHLAVDTDPEIENFSICRFSLQPIMENCVQHGLANASSAIHIAIEVRYEGEDKIRIQISDDGDGMEPEKLAALRRTIQELGVDAGHHFGIGNVNARLALHNEDGASCITVDSEKRRGTRVTVLIDQILRDEIALEGRGEA